MRFLRLARIGAAAPGMSYLLRLAFDRKQDIPGEVWAGMLFLFSGLIYLYRPCERISCLRANDATEFSVAHSPMGRLLPSHTHRITVDGRIYS
jgi:hypothetical protein